MKINIFNLKKRQDDWKEVKHALHQVWIGNQSGQRFQCAVIWISKKHLNKLKEKRH